MQHPKIEDPRYNYTPGDKKLYMVVLSVGLLVNIAFIIKALM